MQADVVVPLRSLLAALTRLSRRLGLVARFWRPWRPLIRGLALLAFLALLGSGYRLTGRPVTLVVNGQAFPLRTHRLHVAAVLRESGLTLRPEDTIWPAPGDGLAPGDVIRVELARPVTIEADGQVHHLFTHTRQVPAIIRQADLQLGPDDEVWIDGQRWSTGAALPAPTAGRVAPRPGGLAAPPAFLRPNLESQRPAPLRILVRRAVPVTLHVQNGPPSTFYTTRHTVGEALLDQGLVLFLGDRVTPSLGTSLSPGMNIFIERSTPVSITADGRTLQTRTRQATVGEVLAQEGIALMGQDYVLPGLDSPIDGQTSIAIVRVAEALEIEEEITPFESQWVPDPELELDVTVLRQAGSVGSDRRRYRVHYEDGQELWRVLEDEWQASEPATKIVAYGTKIVPRTVQTEEGELPYWRKIRMLATTYSAATSGKTPDHPRYGITRSGLPAGYGIVAVDPTVIPLGTRLYVPGYGVALAGDTGGAIIGKHIDLGFDEDQPPLWYYWTEVYILGDPPPRDQIRFVLPQWPQER